MQRFAVADGGVALELEFAWDHVLGEVALADEIWHDIHLWRIDHEKRFAHRGFLFPEADMDLGEESTPAYFIRVVEIRGRGIRVFRGTVTDDEQGRIWLGGERHDGKWRVFPGLQAAVESNGKALTAGVIHHDGFNL